MIFKTAILFLLAFAATAQADVLHFAFSNGECLDVQPLVSLPDNFEVGTSAWPGALLTDLRRRRWLKGGTHFVDGSFNYSPPIPPTGLPLCAGAFAVSPANSDDFLLSMDGTGDPSYIVVGEIVSDMAWLMNVGQNGEYDLFGLHSLPVDSNLNPIYQTGYSLRTSMTLDGPIPLPEPSVVLSAPEPATILLIVPALLSWRNR